MKSKICSSKYVKTVSKGKGWIPAFLTLGFLLAFPVVSLLLIGNWRGSGYTPEQMSLLYENLWKDGFLITGGVITILAAVLNGSNGFIYLYSRRQTDFYHSLPVKRSRMFWNRVYTGLVYYLAPYVVMEFLTVCIGAARGFFSLELMASAIFLCLLHLLLYLMVYFSVVLILSITGNLLMGSFCLLMLYFYGPALSLLLGCYRHGFYDTYYMGRDYGLIRFLKEYASPAGLAGRFAEAYGRGEGMGILFVILLLTVIFAVLSYAAYLKRPSETAGQPMVYGLAERIVKVLVVIPGGLAAGYIFFLIPTGSSRIFWWVFGLILGTVLAHGFMETAYQMDFHCFFKKKLELAGIGAAVAVCALTYHTEILRYDTYLPRQDRLESISLNTNVFSGNMSSYVEKNEDGTYKIQINSSDWDMWEYSIPGKKGIGDKTYEVLERIVKKQNKREVKRWAEGKSSETAEERITFRAAVRYRLKSGKEIYRNYRISTEECRDLMVCLYEEENLRSTVLSFLELEKEYLEQIYLNTADGRGYPVFQENEQKRNAFLKTLKKDIENSEPESFTGVPCVSVELSYLLPGSQDINSMVPGKAETKNYAYGSVNIYPDYKDTLSLLKEAGYPVSVEEIPVEKAVVVYYQNDTEKKVIYEKTEEIQALKEAAVPASGFYSWLECTDDISVTMQTGSGNEFYISLLEEKLPDFVIRDRKTVEDKEKKEEEDISTAAIGGADGPTSIIIKSGGEENTDD